MFYLANKSEEGGGLRTAPCGNERCEAHRKPALGATDVRSWGRFVRLERWDWACPSCANVDRHYWVMVG
jgi:hypothetical protein